MSWKKLKLLIWKNFVLQRRHKWQTVFEISSPVVFGLFLILIRSLIEPEIRSESKYEAFQPTFFNISGQNLGNLTVVKREGSLAFSPESPLTRGVVNKAIETVVIDNVGGLLALLFDASMLPQPIGYKNGQEMEEALNKPNVMNRILCGIQFDQVMANSTSWPKRVKVTLRFPGVMRTPMLVHPLKASWRTNLLLPLFPSPGPRHPSDKYGGTTPGYSSEMFLAVQHAITLEIIKNKTGKTELPRVVMRRLPQPPYIHDLILDAMERFISMIIMLCFAFTFINTVKAITLEKELQLTETMTIMGLPRWLHWLAWFIKQLSFLSISVLFMALLLKLPVKAASTGQRFAILTNTPWSILFFFLFLFVIVSLAFSFMVSVFFSKANTAAAFMGLAWFSTYSVYMLTQVLYENTTLAARVWLSLISNTAIGFAFQLLVICEGSKRGLQWNALFDRVSYHDEFTPAHVAGMLVLDSILYMLVAMYVEKIRPGVYGVPSPWYFPLTKNFWRPKQIKQNLDNSETDVKDALLNVVHDEEPTGIPLVYTQNLTKIYGGTKKAVDKLNLRVYKDEITVLLGHNGAGKTTTVSMLTGTIPPTSGTAKINGYDIVTETVMARKSLGICPQHNVLFPDLTVAEHIKFYGQLKGVPHSKINDEVDHFIKLLALESKCNVISSQLSGGQKRRLSVGVAMCGDSAVVLLDEPTSGLDPASRRSLWDLLQRMKKGRAMILTTHFMDEADFLGDRIAIMSGGKLQCIGTPYFLKKHYGLGYKLSIVKVDGCDVQRVTEFIHKHVPDAVPNTDIGSELTYILLETDISKFPALLKELEEIKADLKVESYGLTVTNLEEVFMKVGAEERSDNRVTSPPPRNFSGFAFTKSNGNGLVHPLEARLEDGQTEVERLQKVTGWKLQRNHIKAMFLKLFHDNKRNKLIILIQLLSPIINILLSVLISRSWKFITGLPPLKLSLTSGFKETVTLLSESDLSGDSDVEKAYKIYKEYFKASTYPGMRLKDIGTADLGQRYLKMINANYDRVRTQSLIGATFSSSNVTAWFSNYGYHDSAISLRTVDNAIFGAVSPGSSITIINHPLPYSVENLVKVMASGSSMGFQFAFNMGFCMAFVTAFFVVFVIKERTSGARLLQRISGVRPAVLWSVALLWDLMRLFVVHLGIIFTLLCVQEMTLSEPAELGRVFLVLNIFSLAILPLHYLASFYFDAPATGFAKMCFMNIFCGSMPFLITEVLRLPEVGSPYYATVFDCIFSIFPIYCLSRSFRDMTVSSLSIKACDAMCEQFPSIKDCTREVICTNMKINLCCIEGEPYLEWSEPGIGRYLFIMTLVGVVAFAVLLFKEYELLDKIFKRSKVRPLVALDPNEDGDVKAERTFVEAIPKEELQNYSLVCRDLTKYYKNFLAVNRLTFAVRKGECFGLLGVNGAGKTSTFRVLTGDARLSGGDALVLGHSAGAAPAQAHARQGYCPQFDALLDNLTARETLEIFCLLRGIPVNIGLARAKELAMSLGFIKHFDKRVQQCSGGTKRKISTAVALLGDAPLVFLDEPTTGMDPASKRLVWSCINEAVRSGRSVVLTTHSMEESEALCSRLTVMTNGIFRCLGSLQHLKSKFSQGYTLTVKCKSTHGKVDETAAEEVNKFVLEKFLESKLIEKYHSIYTYYVDSKNLTWWQVFQAMEEATKNYAIEDYSVTQTTLEQVFLRFTRL